MMFGWCLSHVNSYFGGMCCICKKCITFYFWNNEFSLRLWNLEKKYKAVVKFLRVKILDVDCSIYPVSSWANKDNTYKVTAVNPMTFVFFYWLISGLLLKFSLRPLITISFAFYYTWYYREFTWQICLTNIHQCSPLHLLERLTLAEEKKCQVLYKVVKKREIKGFVFKVSCRLGAFNETDLINLTSQSSTWQIPHTCNLLYM